MFTRYWPSVPSRTLEGSVVCESDERLVRVDPVVSVSMAQTSCNLSGRGVLSSPECAASSSDSSCHCEFLVGISMSI